MSRDEISESDISQLAAEWLARSSAGLNSSERIEYECWLASDERHRHWTETHQETRQKLSGLSSLIPDRNSEPDPDLFALPESEANRKKWFVPASIIGFAASFLVLFLFIQKPQIGNFFPADDYEKSFVAIDFDRQFLADGTLVELKKGSAVEARFDSQRREINLIKGEAHFSVTKDRLRPFIVHAGGASFRAIGTAFNVRLSSEEVELLVTEGVVGVEEASIEADLETRPSVQEPFSNRFQANQKATFSKSSGTPLASVATVTNAEVDLALQWKHEVLDFDATPLFEAVEAFNLRNRDQIEIRDRTLGAELIDGAFRSDNLAGFVKALEVSANINVEKTRSGTYRLRLRD